MGLLHRGAWGIILVSLILAVLSVYYAFHNLSFRTNRSDLVASDQRLIRLGEQLDKDFGSRDDLVVVVENGHPQTRTIAFAEALAGELKKYPKRFPEIFYRVDPEPFKKWALLYLETPDLKKLHDKLLEHRQIMAAIAANPTLTQFFQAVNQEITRAMISEVFTSFLEEDQDKEVIPDISLLNATLSQLKAQLDGEKSYVSPLNSIFPGDLGDFSQEGYLFTENKKYLLFLVTPREDGFTT